MIGYKEVADAVTSWFVIRIVLWVLCGLFTIVMMKLDDKAGFNSPYPYVPWFNGWKFSSLIYLLVLILGPFGVVLGLLAMCDWRNNKKTYGQK